MDPAIILAQSQILQSLSRLREELGSDGVAQRNQFINQSMELGGKPYAERCKKYGVTERGIKVELNLWQAELTEGIGDLRLSHTMTMGPSQLGKTLTHIWMVCDSVTTGRLNVAWIFDSAQNLTTNVPLQFRPVIDHWLANMLKNGKRFRRESDRQMVSRYQVEGCNVIFSYASTSKASLRGAGQAAAGSAVVSFQADMMFLEERSQYPPGASDPLPRRLDASVIPTKPIRELGTPGSGTGIETEFRTADFHFYPHYTCPHCQQVRPLDPKGCLLKSMQRIGADGIPKLTYLSESGRPIEWHHKDPERPVDTAYFGCSACGSELTLSDRLSARFKCIKTGEWLRDFLDKLPPGAPRERYKVGFHLTPLSRRTETNLAAELIRGGLEAIDPADWQQQGLGYPSEAFQNSLTISVLERAIIAPPADRRPELRCAGIDQGRGQYWLWVADYCLPPNWREKGVEENIDSAIRNVVWAGDVTSSSIPDRLRSLGVNYGFCDNEPERTEAARIQRTTVLRMADQRPGLADAIREDSVEEGGERIPCLFIRNEKFLSQVLNSFLKVAEDGYPLQRLPEDWRRWIASPTDRSPIKHLMGPKRDVSGKWFRSGMDDIYYAAMFCEAAFYWWLRKAAANAYIPGTVGSVKSGAPARVGGFGGGRSRLMPSRSRFGRGR